MLNPSPNAAAFHPLSPLWPSITMGTCLCPFTFTSFQRCGRTTRRCRRSLIWTAIVDRDSPPFVCNSIFFSWFIVTRGCAVQTLPFNLPSTHVYRTVIHNLIAQAQEMYDPNSKICNEVTEMSGYFLGFAEPPLSISSLREVADRTVRGEYFYSPGPSGLRRIQVS